MSGNDDKKGKVESLSYHPVMLRLDRSILGIGGDGRGITRSSRVMTGREENVGDNGREREDGRERKVGNFHSTRSCSGLTGASGKLVAAVRGLPDQVGQ